MVNGRRPSVMASLTEFRAVPRTLSKLMLSVSRLRLLIPKSRLSIPLLLLQQPLLTGQVYFVASIVSVAVGLLPGGCLGLLLLQVQVRVRRAVSVEEGDLGAEVREGRWDLDSGRLSVLGQESTGLSKY